MPSVRRGETARTMRSIPFFVTASDSLQGQSGTSRSLAYRIVTSRLAHGHSDGHRLDESQCIDLPERRDLPARKPHPRLSLKRPCLARDRRDDRAACSRPQGVDQYQAGLEPGVCRGGGRSGTYSACHWQTPTGLSSPTPVHVPSA